MFGLTEFEEKVMIKAIIDMPTHKRIWACDQCLYELENSSAGKIYSEVLSDGGNHSEAKDAGEKLWGKLTDMPRKERVQCLSFLERKARSIKKLS